MRDVLVLPWTKMHHIPSMKLGNNKRSITYRPTSSLQSSYLAPAVSAIVDNDECQRHTEKLISPDVKNGKNTKLLI
jgi:hypothetical protein